jgi:hypothetical protein
MREEWKSAAIEDYQKSYRVKWNRVFGQIQSNRYDHHVWLLGPSSYVLLTDGIRWGMDLQFRMPWILDTVRDKVVEDLSTLDFILLTHEHSDHLDYSLLSMLADQPIRWIIPAFFDQDKILATGLSPQRITWVEPGHVYVMGSFTLTTFDSLHFRPNGQGVREIGYLVKTSRSRILFPGDVRDYNINKMPHFGQIDCLFSHVWLGGGNALNLPCEPYLTNFCDFTIALNSKLVFLTHLYEIGRPIEEMWTYTHAGLAVDGLLARNPSLEIVVPRIGKAYSLF